MGSGEQDRYVTGGVNWESYTLEDLVAMVAENASAPQLERLADDWRAAGAEVTDAAAVLATALEELMQYWSGIAAEQARADVALNAQWVGDLGETAHKIGDPVQEAAGALKAAQDAMPEIPPIPPSPPALAVDAADRGLVAGGPMAAAINATAAGADSAFAAQQEQAHLKAVAVEAMKRFEGAALGIDAATPQFAERDTELRPRPEVPPVAPPGWDPVSYVTDVELRWLSLTGGDPTTTAQGYDSTGSDSGAHGSSGLGGSGGRGGGLGGGAGVGAGAGAPAPLQSGMSTGLTEAFPASGKPTPVGGAAAHAAAGGGHAPMGGGMPMGGMGAGAGHGGDQGEHRRRYPFDADDPFALDQKASPPVIGL